jgi:hypothetical protein
MNTNYPEVVYRVYKQEGLHLSLSTDNPTLPIGNGFSLVLFYKMNSCNARIHRAVHRPVLLHTDVRYDVAVNGLHLE